MMGHALETFARKTQAFLKGQGQILENSIDPLTHQEELRLHSWFESFAERLQSSRIGEKFPELSYESIIENLGIERVLEEIDLSLHQQLDKDKLRTRTIKGNDWIKEMTFHPFYGERMTSLKTSYGLYETDYSDKGFLFTSLTRIPERDEEKTLDARFHLEGEILYFI